MACYEGMSAEMETMYQVCVAGRVRSCSGGLQASRPKKGELGGEVQREDFQRRGEKLPLKEVRIYSIVREQQGLPKGCQTVV